MKTDILTRSDVQRLVDIFYEKVRADALLAPHFAHVDWPHHLPVMYSFWSSVLLGDMSYSGNPIGKHLPLKLEPQHFTRWLALFTEIVDENFEGDTANEAKKRAYTIANLIQFKMGLTHSEVS